MAGPFEKVAKNNEKGAKSIGKFFSDISDTIFKSCKDCGRSTDRTINKALK